MVGLAIGNSNSNFSDIDCAMFCDKGTLRAYELGKHTWDGPRYIEGHVLGVRRAGSVVTFLQNGTLLRTCSRRLSGNVLADVSMHDAQGGVLEASWMGGQLQLPGVNVIWNNLRCKGFSSASQSGNSPPELVNKGGSGCTSSKRCNVC